VDARIVAELVDEVHRRDLRRGEPPRRKILLRGLDVLPHVDARQPAGVPVEDRNVEPGLHALGDLAAAVGRIRLEQRGHQVRPAGEHLVVDRHGARQVALAAGLGGLQAQQPDDVDRVGVVLQAAVGLVVAHLRIADIEAEVLHMAEQVALGILRSGAAEPRADAQVCRGLLLPRPCFDRQAAQHEEAAPFEELREDPPQDRAECGERKACWRERFEGPAAREEAAHRGLDFRHLTGGEVSNPVGARGEIAPAPHGGALNRLIMHAGRIS
jgi:hypothetical protein